MPSILHLKNLSREEIRSKLDHIPAKAEAALWQSGLYGLKEFALIFGGLGANMEEMDLSKAKGIAKLVDYLSNGELDTCFKRSYRRC